MKQSSNEPTISLRERNKERTRQEIIDTAIELFQEKGFDNVPVEMICQKVGISRATFFNYFPQKEVILLTLAEERKKLAQHFINEKAKEWQGYNFNDVMKLFMLLAEINEREREKVRYLILEMIRRPACQAALLSARESARQIFLELLTKIRKNGEKFNSKFKLQDISNLLTTLYFATVLEWLNLADPPSGWLGSQLRLRLRMVAEGILKPEELKDE